MNDHCKNYLQSFDALLGRVEVTIKDYYYYCLDEVSSQITDLKCHHRPRLRLSF